MPRCQQSPKSYFKREDQSQGNNVIDLVVIWKNIIGGEGMPNEVIAKDKVDNIRTERQDKNIDPGHKRFYYFLGLHLDFHCIIVRNKMRLWNTDASVVTRSKMNLTFDYWHVEQ